MLIVGLLCLSQNASEKLGKSYVSIQALHDIHDFDTVEVETAHHQMQVMKLGRRIRTGTPTRPAPAGNISTRMGSPPAPEKPCVRLLLRPPPPPSS